MTLENAPRLIAEIGANHMGNMDLAKAMVDAAASAGCDTVKFQSWRADMLRTDFPDFQATFARHVRTQLSDGGHRELIDYCAAKGVKFLTTCFDIDRVEFLASLGLEEIKVASPDCGSIRMIEKLMKHFSRLIISTGMTDDKEVLRSIEATRGHDVVYLHCVSLYPTPPEHVNLARMEWLRGQGVRVGFSDHTLGTAAPKLALARGAEIIEKHFTLSRRMPGKDQTVSGEPDEFREIAEWIRTMTTLTGSARPTMTTEERTLQGIYVGKWGYNA